MPLLSVANKRAPGWVKAGGAVFQDQALQLHRINYAYHVPLAQRKRRGPHL